MRPSMILYTLIAAFLLLVGQPSYAQTSEDPNAAEPTTTTDTTASEGEEADDESGGNFSRSIPQGISGNLTDEERADYQAQLDAAATPQERNVIRQEIQRQNQARHLETVQGEKAKPKGFFANMAADFKDIVSGKAAKDAKAKSEANKSSSAKDGKDRSNDKGGKGSGKSGGGNGGGNGGGGGGGRNK